MCAQTGLIYKKKFCPYKRVQNYLIDINNKRITYERGRFYTEKDAIAQIF
jgi:hypothetical protein